MINMYDFVIDNSSYFDQLKFGNHGELFIDYLCPIKENQALVWSDKNCLMYVMTGRKGYASGEYFHDSQEHEVLFIRKGGYILHQRFQKPYHALIFMFDDFSIRDFLAAYPHLLATNEHTDVQFMNQPVVLPLQSSAFVESIFGSSLDYLKQPTPESHVSMELKFKELLVNLLRQKDSNYFYSYLSWLCNDENGSFVKLMRENSHCNFTIEELARTAGMSLSSFKRRFKSNFGISPGRWLDEQRIARAIALLFSSSNTISEIAFELGYNDASAFSKAFKRTTGNNPAHYRRKSPADLK